MKKSEVLILHSGGIDSTALINFFLKSNSNVTSIHIVYGQVSAKNEARAVKNVCKYYGIPTEKIEVKAKNLFRNGFIQGRNLFLLSSALVFANFKMGQIAIGIHDGTNYVDCGVDFLQLTNKIFTLYSNGSVVASAPFLKWNKSQIMSYCLQESIPINLTYSCELGLKQPCGKCLTCKELIQINGSTN